MLLLTYLYWHYLIAPVEILKLLQNYSIATWHKFLIWGHLRTLFYPWHRIRLSDVVKPATLVDKFGNFLGEIYIRLFVAMIRLTVVAIGLIIEGLVFTFFAVLFIAWLIWPALIFISITKGVSLLI